MSKTLIKVVSVNNLLKKTSLFRQVYFNENFRLSSDLVVNHQLNLDPSCKVQLNEGMKHKKHGGIVMLKKVSLSCELSSAASCLIEKYPIKDLKNKSEELVKYLWSRHVPMEKEIILEMAQKLEFQFLQEERKEATALSLEERDQLEKKVKSKVLTALRKLVYHWEPIKYDAYRSFLYLVGRLAFDYSAALQVFSEIGSRGKDFSPKTALHFGSGLGSTVWAADSVWKKSIREHLCCDVSDDMNTLARLLLQGGKEEAQMSIPGIYFRQFFSPSQKTKYDLVVSSFSLNELPNREERLAVIKALWMKTQQFLVIVENGTNAGFCLVNEARDYILEMIPTVQNQDDEEEKSRQGHVFAPCPHDKICPRLVRQDGTPCNFEVTFQNFSQFQKGNNLEKGRISYVVFRRGSREDCQTKSWPRIVRPVSTPSKRVHLRTCAPSGDLEYSIATAAKHGRDLYWCARACQWGDLLPVLRKTEDNESLRSNDNDSDSSNDRSVNSKTSAECRHLSSDLL